MTFSPTSQYNAIAVEFSMTETVDADNRTVTNLRVKASTDYKFRTKHLQTAVKAANSSGKSLTYELISEKLFILSVKN